MSVANIIYITANLGI